MTSPPPPSPATSERWPDEFLDRMREVTDPPADETVEALFREGRVEAVNALMRHLVLNDQLAPEGLPPVVQKFLAETGRLPEWADPSKIREAEVFFGRHGPQIAMILAHASLPVCYSAAKGVRVLYLTARLETDPKRRIAETAQLIINLLEPGGLSAEGQAVRDAQKVRLMHAAVRHLILASGEWDAGWGRPINQEDMAGTLMTFSWTTIESLGKLGIRVEPREAEAYVHTWNVAGHLMGIRGELLPRGVAEAEELLSIIMRRQAGPCDAGRAMTSALIEMIEDQTPGTLFDGLPATMIRHLAGEHTADLLGVPRTDWTKKLVLRSLRVVFGVGEEVKDRGLILGRVAERYGAEFLEGFAWLARGGNRDPFRIPAELREQWQLRAFPSAKLGDEAGERREPEAPAPRPTASGGGWLRRVREWVRGWRR